MSEAAQSATPRRRRGTYLALAALVPLGAAVAAARPLAFPPRPIAPRDLLALAAGAENTGGFRLGDMASVRADTSLYSGITDGPSPAREADRSRRPAVYIAVPVEDRWLIVRSDPAVDCMDTTRLAVADSTGGLPRQYAGRLDSIPPTLVRRVVAALNQRTPDLTESGREGDRWSRKQFLPVMLASEGGVAHRARCAMRRRQLARRDSAAVDSVGSVEVVVRPPERRSEGPKADDLLQVMRERGADVALGWLDGVRAAAPDAPAVQEAEVNGAGYALLRNDELGEALAIFKWNVEHHPRSANAHDSLAEAYEKLGDEEEALRHSRRALELLDSDLSLSGDFRDAVRRASGARVARLR